MSRSFAALPLLLPFLWLVGNAGAETTPITQSAGSVDAADVDAVIKPLIDGQWCVGVTVGLLDSNGRRVLGYGKLSPAGGAANRTPDGKTVYEIGSVSKTFTSLLLAQMVCNKQVALDDAVQRYLPREVELPPRPQQARDGRDPGAPAGKATQPITLAQLATHRSGLPSMPDNFHPADPSNPYADYTVAQLYDFLSHCELRRAPGAKYEYSNLGAGLLGHVLSLKAGRPYEQLLVTNICAPLGMSDTRITLDAGRKARLAPGFDVDGNPLPNWDLPTLAGAGAIRSTADDLLKYLAAQAGLTETTPEMAAAIALTHEIRANVDGLPDTRIALAWHVDTRHGIYWHNGQTGGYHTYVAFSPTAKAGVVVLSNTGTGLVDAAGRILIGKEAGYAVDPLKLPTEAKVDTKAFDRYVGQYLMWPGLVATVARDGDKLLVRITGEPSYRIYPKSETEFFWKAVPARLTFFVDDQGKATKLVLHQNGKDLTGLKVEPEAPLK